jgi:hypothetical protein
LCLRLSASLPKRVHSIAGGSIAVANVAAMLI